MAKKKVSQQSQSQSQSQSLKEPPHTLPMAPPSDDSTFHHQINNLKTLNAVLLKETTDRRHQIDSLESALLLSNFAADTVSVFFDSHFKELSLRLLTLLDDTDHDVSLLRSQLIDFKQLELILNAEKNLRSETRALVSQKQTIIEALNSQKDFAVKKSQESETVIETLKDKVESVTREKNEIDALNKTQEKKLCALELEVTQLEESLKNSDELMRVNVVQLEEKLGFSLEKEEEMKMEISALLKEKEEIEKSVAVLTQQKDCVHKVLDEVKKELQCKQHELDEAVRLSDEIEQVKVNCEIEIVDLREQVIKLKDSCEKLEEENKSLFSEVKRYGIAVDEAVFENERIKKLFVEERKKLEFLISGTQAAVLKSDAELGLVRSERDKLIDKEKMLEGNVNVLRKENDALKSMLEEARKETECLSTKVEVWCNNSNKALAMLKATAAALVCQQHRKDEGEQVFSDWKVVEEEIQGYEQELDAIKKAFKRKDEMMDDMKQQLATLNKSMVEAHKSKSLWTVISSATTIFAAVLAAYFAKGR